MQKQYGRSCGKVPVRQISGACATIALNPLQASGSFYFVFVEFNGRSAKATVMACCRPFLFFLLLLFSFFFFFFFASLFPSPPALCRYLLPLLRGVFVFARKKAVIFFALFCSCNSSYLRVVLSVQQVSVPLQHVCCSSCSLSFPIFLHHILQNTCRLFCFVFFVFFFPFFFFSLFYGLACYVVFSSSVR